MIAEFLVFKTRDGLYRIRLKCQRKDGSFVNYLEPKVENIPEVGLVIEDLLETIENDENEV